MNQGKSPLWLLPGIGLLVTFAWLLTLAPTEHAGCAYAIYGGIYIAASIAWLWAVDGVRPDRWDLVGSAICIVGASIILWGPRTAWNSKVAAPSVTGAAQLSVLLDR